MPSTEHLHPAAAFNAGDTLPACLRGTPVISSVAGSEARQQIRRALRAAGFREARDFMCAA